MKKVIILKGLPASGKSTYAKKLLAGNGNYKRINKDDIRAMLDNGKWSKNNEKFVLKVRNWLIREALFEGFHVIVDDTNLHPKHEQQIRDIVMKHNKLHEKDDALVEIKEFLDVSVEECIKRDLARPNPVGSEVILRMYKQFLAPEPKVYEPPKDKPNAIICDIDGTLAHMDGRGPFDWDKVGTDKFDYWIGNILNLHQAVGATIILVSGRDAVCRKETMEWLAKYGVRFTHLFMRHQGDMRKDFVVKEEIFNKHIRYNYAVMFVLDDRNQTVNYWRSEGLKCLQVAEGDF